ncbi:Structural maintenance of chromosomes protein 3 [Mytilus edulis]|uniref:Structural maintenance of chromosomes protein 3 n=1 Tax=Mytilus edulis TaxID=6550 RepID=A0A8S3STH2_MYTED|nr:Structural maintenance of chromosomes protein 3 [Mytilus edulis]
MYIKQVIIQGFRSYRDQTVVDPFSSKHNVIVGRNGSGKSNFFYAIQFVLSDEFSHLRPEQRQALLHEGTGPRVISAFVEIIFDNSDNRIPIEKDEVVLRRVIGSKKDQYFLDKKMVTKGDVMNLLESAGFSRSNPYYIVKQGKINQMATAPDSQRLKLLREVAGTKVYDERKEESKVILRETEGKREKINDLLKYIEERLATLEEEKEELKEYQKWDKMRRSLEYTIHDHELRDTRKKLDELQDKRENSGTNTQKIRDLQQSSTDKVKAINKDLRDLKSRMQSIHDEKEQLTSENQDLTKKKAKLELNIKDIQDELEGDKSARKKAEEELKKVSDKIVKTENQLEEITPKYDAEQRKEEECTRQLSMAEQRRKELYAKQGRGNQFTSRDDRDAWIKKELKSLNRAIRDKEEQIKEDLVNDDKRAEHLRTQIEEVSTKIDQNKDIIGQNDKNSIDMKRERDVLMNDRNALWRQENILQQEISSTREELSKKEQALRSMTGKGILNGIDSVKKVLQSFTDQGKYSDVVNGYRGILIENLDTEKTFFTCVEVTAGNRLFHHVVDTDKTGTKILTEMNRLRLPGEVTFMPLNRLDARDTNYPDTNDAIPMISKLKYEKEYDRAIKHVFGKTLICRNMETGTQIARTQNLDCVTLDGDQVSRRGALTGGFYDTRRSRLDLQKSKLELTEKLENQEKEYAEHKSKLETLEGKMNNIVSEMQKTETRNSKNKDTFDKMRADLRLMTEELNSIEKSKSPKEKSVASLHSSLEAMQGSAASLNEELGSDLLSQLSVEDQGEVDKLNDTIKQLTQQNKEALTERIRLEGDKNKLENLLHNNLMKKRDRLTNDLQEVSVEDRKNKLESLNQELQTVDDRVQEIKSHTKELDGQLEKMNKEQKSLQNNMEHWKAQEKEFQDKIKSFYKKER